MSKRQNTLLKRINSEKEQLAKTKNKLNSILLSKLHRQGIYTTDDLHSSLISKSRVNQTKHNAKVSIAKMDNDQLFAMRKEYQHELKHGHELRKNNNNHDNQ